MSLRQVAARLVDLCRQGKNMDAVAELYDKDVVSVEAVEGGGMPREQRGIETITAKGQWWFDNHIIHGGEVSAPMFHGDDRFACIMRYDVTFKPANQRMKMEEVAVYTVKNGKIVREEFFYDMGEGK